MDPEILETYIREALFPFEPGRIEVVSQEQWHNRATVIGVRCQALKSHPFQTELPDAVALDITPSIFSHLLGDMVRRHIQSIPIIPTESHHILGEN